jgi:hypothetical protein
MSTLKLWSCPIHFERTWKRYPPHSPTSTWIPARVARDKLRIDVTWRAGDWDFHSNIPFQLITKLAELPGVTFHVLQQDAAHDERHERSKPILDPKGNVLATAQRVRALNLVISVDSMPAHLAGALGLQTWTLLQRNADWRWMIEREDSPWYPTMRLFRQDQPQDWGPVMARVAVELQQLKEL